MKWNWLPPYCLEPKTSSKPYAQSIPNRPTIGKNIRTPTPAERFMSNGLKSFTLDHALPPVPVFLHKLENHLTYL